MTQNPDDLPLTAAGRASQARGGWSTRSDARTESGGNLQSTSARGRKPPSAIGTRGGKARLRARGRAHSLNWELARHFTA